MRKRLPILFAILLVGMLAWVTLRHKEPVYHGKSLTNWLQDYSVRDLPPGGNSVYWESRRGVDEAVHVIGTNCIPTLLHLLRAKDSELKLKMIRLAQKQHFVAIRPFSAGERNEMARLAFFELGHKADSALPALVDIYEQNISAQSRICALIVIGHIGLPVKRIVPSLVVQASDPNRRIRYPAVSALAEMHCEPEQVVPVLIKALRDPVSDVRLSAVIGLGAFGPAAKPAVPALIESLSDTDAFPRAQVEIRAEAAKSLRAIDPEAADKAGVK